MQLEDRPEFEELIAQLCAGYEVPLTKHRKSAHWESCKRMTLGQYRKSVEFALSDDGPAELPMAKQMRKLLRGPEQPNAPQVRPSDPSHIEYFADRLLVQHIASRGGVGPELQSVLEAKRKLVEEFVGYVREGDDLATPAMFIRAWLSVMRRASPPTDKTLQGLKELIAAEGMETPFPSHMARHLEADMSQPQKSFTAMDMP